MVQVRVCDLGSVAIVRYLVQRVGQAQIEEFNQAQAQAQQKQKHKHKYKHEHNKRAQAQIQAQAQ